MRAAVSTIFGRNWAAWVARASLFALALATTGRLLSSSALRAPRWAWLEGRLLKLASGKARLGSIGGSGVTGGASDFNAGRGLGATGTVTALARDWAKTGAVSSTAA